MVLKGAIQLVVPDIYIRGPLLDFLSYETSDNSVADNKKKIREMRLVLPQNCRSTCCCAQNKQTTVSFLYYLLYPWWSNLTVQYAQRWSSVSDDVVYV